MKAAIVQVLFASALACFGAGADARGRAADASVYTQAPVYVTRADVRAKEVFIEDAAVIDVKSAPEGFTLRMEPLDPLVSEVEVEGLGHVVRVSSPTTIYVPPRDVAAPYRTQLRYRVRYSDGVNGRFRPAPLRIAVGS